MSTTSPPLAAKVQSSHAILRESISSEPFSVREKSSSCSSESAASHHQIDSRVPIPEENDSTTSTTITSGLTSSSAPRIHDEPNISEHSGYSFPVVHSPLKPLNTAIPRSGAGSGNTPGPASGVTTPDQNKIFTKENLKRTMSNIFKKSNTLQQSPSGLQKPLSPTSMDPFDTVIRRDGAPIQSGPSIKSQFATRPNSPPTPRLTRPNTPPNLSDVESHIQFESEAGNKNDPTPDLYRGRRKSRSLTGHFFKDILHKHAPKITFAAHDKVQPRSESRHRASSVDTIGSKKALEQSGLQPEVTAIQEQVWNIPAPVGVGLKARRMSQTLPDNFFVPVNDLYEDYADSSKFFGRRGKLLGKGATAHVKLMTGKREHSGDLYAVKEFRPKGKNENTDEYEQKVKSEFTIARSIRHPNVVRTFSLCTHNGRWNHVMELCDQGDLFGLVQKHYLNDQEHLKDRLCLFKQLVQGISYLHHHGIAHRDIKLENLLITKQGQLKITDFGVSEVFSGLHPGIRSANGECGVAMDEIRLCAPGICGSPPYIAPEVMAKEGSYDPRATDVWAAAIVMISMTANGTLWSEARPGSSAVYDSLVNGWEKWNATHPETLVINETDYPHVSFFDKCINPPALRRILLEMLNPNPGKRSSIQAVSTNRWLKNVECCQLESVQVTEAADAETKEKNDSAPKRICRHNHLPPAVHHGHRLVRLPGTTDI
ncbi:hypothetical protein PVAG01_11162 [Phlyctema vagabunda]|uniref:Protein kinase domain-containing protein n=1 Tax=Phlyctema vagabunda TaxID=108571 RepID=A0ABR4P1J2_9HELO